MNEPTKEEILRVLEEQHAKILELYGQYGHVERLFRAVAELTEKISEQEVKLTELASELFVHQTWIEALQQLTAPKQLN